MNKDERSMLKVLAENFGSQHFNIAKMHRALYTKRHGAWIVFDQDELKRDMGRFVRNGFAIESTGPRGGAGWSLTTAGIHAAAHH